MNVKKMIKLVVMSMAMISMVASAERMDSTEKAKASAGKTMKSPKRQQSRFDKEFSAWAAKQDWFALSAAAEFGDLNRDKLAEKGMTFGYSVEFVDSKGAKHILGIGLGKEPEQEEKRARTKGIVEMCAKKNFAMHGKPVSTDASGIQSRSVSGIFRGTMRLLCETILKPGTEEKWILFVCTGKPQMDNASKGNVRQKKGQ